MIIMEVHIYSFDLLVPVVYFGVLTVYGHDWTLETTEPKTRSYRRRPNTSDALNDFNPSALLQGGKVYDI